MALCASATQAQEIDLDLRRFEEFKNFANKIWNGARFVLMNLEGSQENNTKELASEEFGKGLDIDLLALEDRWILSVLNGTIATVNNKLSLYLFDQATTEAYDFFWKLFCAYYLEIVKPYLFGKMGTPAERCNKQKLLVIILLNAIRLLHPMAPFITEELFQLLKLRLTGAKAAKHCDPYTLEAITALNCPACIVAPYPNIVIASDRAPNIDAAFNTIEKVVYTIRNIRGEMKISPSIAIDIYIVGQANEPNFQSLSANCNILKALVKTNTVLLHTNEPKDIGPVSTAIVEGLKIILPIPKELIEKEKNRLLKEKEKVSANLLKLQTQLSNPEFVNNAPSQLIESQRQSLMEQETKLKEIDCKLIKYLA